MLYIEFTLGVSNTIFIALCWSSVDYSNIFGTIAHVNVEAASNRGWCENALSTEGGCLGIPSPCPGRNIVSLTWIQCWLRWGLVRFLLIQICDCCL